MTDRGREIYDEMLDDILFSGTYGHREFMWIDILNASKKGIESIKKLGRLGLGFKCPDGLDLVFWELLVGCIEERLDVSSVDVYLEEVVVMFAGYVAALPTGYDLSLIHI